MGTSTRKNNNVNVPVVIQKDPINATNVKNPAAKVNKIYK